MHTSNELNKISPHSKQTGGVSPLPISSFSKFTPSAMLLLFIIAVSSFLIKPGAAGLLYLIHGETLASREYFYVGGSYVNTSAGHLFTNQMYVEKLSPRKTKQAYPLVFIHGQAQTGTVSTVHVEPYRICSIV